MQDWSDGAGRYEGGQWNARVIAGLCVTENMPVAARCCGLRQECSLCAPGDRAVQAAEHTEQGVHD